MANLDEQSGNSGEPCTRRRLDFYGENIYVLVGADFVDLSYSNGADPTKMVIRELLSVVGDAITALMRKKEIQEGGR